MIKDLERYIEVENITKYLESRDKAVYSLMVYDDRRCCRRSCFDFKRSIPYYYKG